MDGAPPLDMITRLCHFTPLRNLVHLASERTGLLSLRQLTERSGDYDQQDLERLDGHPDHVCCSIQYPNAWYLSSRKLRATPIQRLFPDWVCLALDPRHLWEPGTRVCVRNASALGGALVEDISQKAFDALYAPSVVGSGGKLYVRGPTRLRACPTDDQCEVLVHRAIPLIDVQTVIVAGESDAKRFYAALEQIGAGIDGLCWAIAPTLFDARALSRAIARGTPPSETLWEPW